ncbi:hypothetical protein F7725_025738, partial [Dissostichus mawsoni]
MEKVVPQPDLKKETPAEPEQHTEVSVAAPEKPAEPQINVEEPEEHTDNRPSPQVFKGRRDAGQYYGMGRPHASSACSEAGRRRSQGAEQLQQHQLEEARVAEEIARTAAEEAVRQLEAEQSAKLVVETVPVCNEPSKLQKVNVEVCIPIKSFLLQFPLAVECLERGRKLMHDHNLAPPTLSMPTPPPELAMLTQELQQLSSQARQCCTSIASRLARL